MDLESRSSNVTRAPVVLRSDDTIFEYVRVCDNFI